MPLRRSARRRRTQAHSAAPVHRSHRAKMLPVFKMSREMMTEGRRKRPVRKGPVSLAGASLVAGAGIGIAQLIGVGELALGMILAYTSYRVLRYREDPFEALRAKVMLEPGEEVRKVG